jgi:8-oxo-dGTP diphosphatase
MTNVSLPPWDEWLPVDRATLVFIRRGEELLLIRKLRGLGAGKINAPGGRLEPGESKLDCARREVVEELCVVPLNLEECGELRFQFVDGYSIHAHVFSANGCEGDPQTTDEAIPIWTHNSAIPYSEMWADDVLWVPQLLSGQKFRARFVFDGDRMLEHDVEYDPSPFDHG